MFPLERPDWMKKGRCRGQSPSIFIQTAEEVGYVDYGPARTVCDGCPVRKECLDYALEHEEPGFWGGTTERDRRKIRKKMAS